MWVINVFALRTQCLFDIEDMGFEVYREEMMPHTVLKKGTGTSGRKAAGICIECIP